MFCFMCLSRVKLCCKIKLKSCELEGGNVFEGPSLNKANRHKSRAPSLQRQTDRQTDRQSGL